VTAEITAVPLQASADYIENLVEPCNEGVEVGGGYVE
jgi:hypothetical protein